MHAAKEKNKNEETFCTNRTRRFKSRVNYAESFFHPGRAGSEAEGWSKLGCKKKGKEEEIKAEKIEVGSVTQIQPAAVLQWKHQEGKQD